MDPGGAWGLWSHAFLFQGTRHDNQHWVIESDLQFHRKQYPTSACRKTASLEILRREFLHHAGGVGFQAAGRSRGDAVKRGPELVSKHARYSLRELVGTVIALRGSGIARGRESIGAEKLHVLLGIRAAPFREGGHRSGPGRPRQEHHAGGDISRTAMPHVTYLLQREPPPEQITRTRARGCAGGSAPASKKSKRPGLKPEIVRPWIASAGGIRATLFFRGCGGFLACRASTPA